MSPAEALTVFTRHWEACPHCAGTVALSLCFYGAALWRAYLIPAADSPVEAEFDRQSAMDSEEKGNS